MGIQEDLGIDRLLEGERVAEVAKDDRTKEFARAFVDESVRLRREGVAAQAARAREEALLEQQASIRSAARPLSDKARVLFSATRELLAGQERNQPVSCRVLGDDLLTSRDRQPGAHALDSVMTPWRVREIAKKIGNANLLETRRIMREEGIDEAWLDRATAAIAGLEEEQKTGNVPPGATYRRQYYADLPPLHDTPFGTLHGQILRTEIAQVNASGAKEAPEPSV